MGYRIGGSEPPSAARRAPRGCRVEMTAGGRAQQSERREMAAGKRSEARGVALGEDLRIVSTISYGEYICDICYFPKNGDLLKIGPSTNHIQGTRVRCSRTCDNLRLSDARSVAKRDESGIEYPYLAAFVRIG